MIALAKQDEDIQNTIIRQGGTAPLVRILR